MRYFTDSILLLLYSTLTFFYVPADQALVFALLFAVILCCITYLCKVCKTESCSQFFASIETRRKYHSGSCRKLCDLWIIFPVVFGSSSVFPESDGNPGKEPDIFRHRAREKMRE